MHKTIYGQCTIHLEIKATSSILVQKRVAEGAKSMATFFMAYDPKRGREFPCIPGSSLKGVLRSACEKIMRSFHPQLSCDPLKTEPEQPGYSCSTEITTRMQSGELAPQQAYGALCPACRLFGCTAHAGLITLEDAWLQEELRPETRTGIAIDRFTGGVKLGKGGKRGALYAYKPIPDNSRFSTTMMIANFELWHIGLLALVFREISKGNILLGGGKRRGLGQATVQVQELRFNYPVRLYPSGDKRPGAICSAQLLIPEERRAKNSYPPDQIWLGQGLVPQQSTSWRDAAWVHYVLTDQRWIESIFQECVERALAPRLKAGPSGFCAQGG